MTSLETALAATGFKILGEELVNWLRNREHNLSENDWSEIGIHIARKLTVDYRNIQSSFLHKSRKRRVIQRIESAAEIYRELELVGQERGFDSNVVQIYSELADLCSSWSIETDGLGPEDYNKRGKEFLELKEEYQELIN